MVVATQRKFGPATPSHHVARVWCRDPNMFPHIADLLSARVLQKGKYPDGFYIIFVYFSLTRSKSADK